MTRIAEEGRNVGNGTCPQGTPLTIRNAGCPKYIRSGIAPPLNAIVPVCFTPLRCGV